MSLKEGIWSDCDVVSGLFSEADDTNIICIQGFVECLIYLKEQWLHQHCMQILLIVSSVVIRSEILFWKVGLVIYARFQGSPVLFHLNIKKKTVLDKLQVQTYMQIQFQL